MARHSRVFGQRVSELLGMKRLRVFEGKCIKVENDETATWSHEFSLRDCLTMALHAGRAVKV